jgi:hypothetical protein
VRDEVLGVVKEESLFGFLGFQVVRAPEIEHPELLKSCMIFSVRQPFARVQVHVLNDIATA